MIVIIVNIFADADGILGNAMCAVSFQSGQIAESLYCVSQTGCFPSVYSSSSYLSCSLSHSLALFSWRLHSFLDLCDTVQH
jgi:hypothetical protein